MKTIRLAAILIFPALGACFLSRAGGADLSLSPAPGTGDFVLFDGKNAASILVETNDERAVIRAAGDLVEDMNYVTGAKPRLINQPAGDEKFPVIVGTIGKSKIMDALAAEGKLATNGISGAWESFVLQVVNNPRPGIQRALVIAGSDRRGTIYGIYHLSELIGVSPWHWWADVPVPKRKFLALRGDRFQQGPPAVKYRGIFLNDEDWGLRPWAAKTFEPAAGNLGPKTYSKIFELLLRLHANFLWPAMHSGTAEFNHFPDNREIANEYGIVMGSSHCEQMLRNNVSEWDKKTFGEYNFATNPDGVLKYWEQRVRENGKYENVYTLGMRGIHDSAMPGGGTQREKAARLQTIIADQRDLLARFINPDATQVPQIFCPYKEVLPLYQLMTNLPDDITLVWPDDNYGYIRQFSNARERARSGGAGVYYHVSYWGAPRDYLWLCSTPPALIAEEMTKAFDYGADKVWMLNVGDLKPAELDLEFFLQLAWNPHLWNGTNTYDLLEKQIARDFGNENGAEITSILAEYYRLNFQRKPEHLDFPTNNLFSAAEAAPRLAAWRQLVARVEALEKALPAESRDAFFELVGYPVKAAAAANEKNLAGSTAAADEIHRLTSFYNDQLAGGKWHLMMSDYPRKQVDLGVPKIPAIKMEDAALTNQWAAAAHFPGADFAESRHRVVLIAAHASEFISGQDAHWQKISGLGYNGEAVSVFPTTAAVRSTPEKILSESPCLRFKIAFENAGDWKFVVRALPTFSVEAGKPQRYAIALDDETPQIITLPLSQDEHNRVWQENVLRNAALTESVHAIAQPGIHTLKIWMVDPGLVLDTIEAETEGATAPGYVWPPETRVQK
jgi:hypothetical protein